MFFFRLSARFKIDILFRNENFITNIKNLTNINFDKIPCSQTLVNTFSKINDINEVQNIIVNLISKIIKSKMLNNYRLFDYYWFVAIDATQFIISDNKYENCLTKTKKTKKGEKTKYYSNILEAKLITANGYSLSMLSEFISNEDIENINDSDEKIKQDCEIKAFYRLIPRLKKAYPRLPIVLLLDGLYGCIPVLKLCEEYKINYIITFKEGRSKNAYKEYTELKNISENKFIKKNENIEQEFNYINELLINDEIKINACECIENKEKNNKKIKTKFVYMTNIEVNKNNIEKIVEGGRLRFKIENEGFNTQKNQGFNLEHKYCTKNKAMKTFYYLLQIATIVDQVMVNKLFTKTKIKKIYKTIKLFISEIFQRFRWQVINFNKFEKS